MADSYLSTKCIDDDPNGLEILLSTDDSAQDVPASEVDGGDAESAATPTQQTRFARGKPSSAVSGWTAVRLLTVDQWPERISLSFSVVNEGLADI